MGAVGGVVARQRQPGGALGRRQEGRQLRLLPHELGGHGRDRRRGPRGHRCVALRSGPWRGRQA
eukprot:11978504-Alexandrium_andersonii.AAC.1